MTNNVNFQTDQRAWPPDGLVVEAVEQGDGSKRQVVKVAEGTINIGNIAADGYISTGNTTEVNLAAGATFEGAFDSCIEYGGIRISIYSSHASATRGFEFWCSKDGVSGFMDDSYTIPAATAKTFAAPISAPYFKVRYTNGGTQTTTLKICVLFLKNLSVPSSHRIGDAITDDDDAQLTMSVIKGKTAQGNYVSGQFTNAGNFKMSIEEIESGVIIPITRADDFYNDAFQRLRVSDTDQRFDSEFHYDKAPLLFDDISAGGGSATFQGNSRDVLMATGGTGTGVIAGLRQHWANIYTSGNSQFVILTGTLASITANGRAEIFLRSKVSGTVNEEILPQSAWDVTSGINWSMSHIFIMDFQSLRVGRIRWGLDRSGVAVPMAEITNDNIRATGYWQIPNQPVYWRQYNTADYTYTELGYGDEDNAIGFRYRIPVNASQTMRAICATVKSEGGGNLHDLTGARGSASNGVTKRSVTSTTAFLPVLSIQLKSTLNTYPVKSIVFPRDFEIANDNPIYYEWRVNGALSGASFASVSADSIVNADVSATSITGGRVIRSGYSGSAGAGARNIVGGDLTGKIPLGVSAAGVGDILSLCMVKDSATNASTGASLNFEEVR